MDEMNADSKILLFVYGTLKSRPAQPSLPGKPRVY